jgi:hypothetical protein
MKTFKPMRLFLIVVSCLLAAGGRADKSPPLSVNTDSADMFIEVAETISSGGSIPDEKWERLFETQGYRILNRSASLLEHFKNDMRVAFDPEMQPLRDSILSAPVPLKDTAFLDHMMICNFNDMRGHWEELKTFRERYDFGGIGKTSIEKLKGFLHDPVDSLMVFTTVAIACTEPDARSRGRRGIVVDFNLMYKDPDGITDLLAHEMFHTYRMNLVRNVLALRNPIVAQLDRLQEEGIADMIDKSGDPTIELERLGYPEEVVAFYRDVFGNTSAMLAEFDRITVSYLDGELTEEELSSKMRDYFPIGGHPNGYFITRMLERHGLLDEAIEHFADPVAFIHLYNKAAEKEGTHIFTPRFMDYLETIKL